MTKKEKINTFLKSHTDLDEILAWLDDNDIAFKMDYDQLPQYAWPGQIIKFKLYTTIGNKVETFDGSFINPDNFKGRITVD